MALNLTGYSSWGQPANLAALQQIGYQGQTVGGGEGGIYQQQLYKQGGAANLQKLYDYQQYRKSLQPDYNPNWDGIEWITPGQLAQNGTPTQTTTPTYDQGGVATVGQIEPLHEWQKQGLSELAQPNTAGNANYAQAGNAANQQMDALKQGNTPITAEGLTAIAQKLQNPYQQQVVDTTLQGIDQDAAATRARLTAMGAGRRSFGDSSSAIQLSELARNNANLRASTSANLNYQGYTDALNGANTIATGNANRALTAAPGFGSAASTFTGLGDLARNNSLADSQNKINAGTAVQNQNQRLLDATTGQMSSLYGYDANQIAALQNILAGFQSSTSSGSGSATNGLLSIFK